MPDSGVVSFQVTSPALPAEAKLPNFLPCPPGWREAETKPVICEPWPDGGLAICADDSAHFPGETGCSLIGSACPAEAWPDLFPSGKTVHYVLAGATAGGIGIRASPYATLAEAAAVAKPGEIIALAKGSYPAGISPPAGVTIWGACVAQTILTPGASSASASILESASPGVVVRNMTISGPTMGVGVFGAGAELHLEDVVLDRTRALAWTAEQGGRSTGKNVVIRNTAAAIDGFDGHGIQAVSGGILNATRVVVESNRNTGVAAGGANTQVTLNDFAVRWTLPQQSDQMGGRGILAITGATVNLNRGVVSDNRHHGILVQQASLNLVDVVVENTQPREADQGAGGSIWLSNAVASVSRCRIEDNVGYGLFVREAKSNVTVNDVLIRDTQSTADLTTGTGLAATFGAHVTVERAYLVRNQTVALAAGSAGTVMDIKDLHILETDIDVAGRGGWGLQVGAFAQMSLQRARIEKNRAVGMLISAAFKGQDIVVRETRENAMTKSATGIMVGEGAVATIERLLVEDNSTSGLIVTDEKTHLELSDATIRNSIPDITEGIDGVGIYTLASGRLQGSRVVLENNKTAGLMADGKSTVALWDVRVSDTTLPPCLLNPNCDGLLSSGILAMEGATIALTHFIVSRNGGVGVQVATEGQLDLVDGEVSGHEVGANIVSDTFDFSRIESGVVYRDNTQKLATNRVPLPSVPISPK